MKKDKGKLQIKSMKADLSKYDNSWYHPGGGILKRSLWFFTNAIFFQSPLNPSSCLKVFLLRLFGAKIGWNVCIKPSVNIKYPWLLSIGNNVWIGESVWIDNLADVVIEDNVCISQGAMLLCGNHNYKKETFDLITGKIILKEGSWVGARAVVCPGVTLNIGAVLSVGSIASKSLDENYIYQGIPAVKIKKRI